MKNLKIFILICVISSLLCQTCYSFTVEVKDGQGGRGSSSPKPSPSPGTYIPAPVTAAPVVKPVKAEPEIVKNPMEIDMKNAKTPPPAVKLIEDPAPPSNNMPLILGGVAGAIILIAGIGFFLHKKNANQEF